MKIHEFVWPKDRVDHIARHGVKPEEIEEACFGPAFVQRMKSQGKNPIYYVLGQAAAGRYLFCVEPIAKLKNQAELYTKSLENK